MIRADKFVFQEARFRPELSGFDFVYRVCVGDKTYSFTESLTVPGLEAPTLWGELPSSIQNAMLTALHLMFGIQYWSMFSSGQIVLENMTLSEEQARFWDTVYIKGLGEFFYTNKIDWRGAIRFPHTTTVSVMPESYRRSPRSLLAFGGGKDSIVAAEILKQKGEDFSLFSLGAASVQVASTAIVGRPLLTLRRQADPTAMSMIRDQKVFSGHLPYTAIYTFTGLLGALLFDFSRLVFANEKSADEGNLEYLGMEINHQWSKSSEFEALVKKYIAGFITQDVEVYSSLRQYSELEITKQFVNFPQYHHTFSSCNANFASGIKPSRSPYWCGHCAKCAFVFTALAAYMPKDKVVSIVGKDMFADESLLPLFEQLSGLRDFKPFECVGTAEEMRMAIRAAIALNVGQSSIVLDSLSERLG